MTLAAAFKTWIPSLCIASLLAAPVSALEDEEAKIDIPALMKKPNLSTKERSAICGEIYQKYEQLPLLKNHVFRLGLNDLPPVQATTGWSFNTVMALGCIKNQNPDVENVLVRFVGPELGEHSTQVIWALGRMRSRHPQLISQLVAELERTTPANKFLEKDGMERVADIIETLGYSETQDERAHAAILKFWLPGDHYRPNEKIPWALARIKPKKLETQLAFVHLLKAGYYQSKREVAHALISWNPRDPRVIAELTHLATNYKADHVPVDTLWGMHKHSDIRFFSLSVHEYALLVLSHIAIKNPVVTEAIFERLKLALAGDPDACREQHKIVEALGKIRARNEKYSLVIATVFESEVCSTGTVETGWALYNMKIKSERLDQYLTSLRGDLMLKVAELKKSFVPGGFEKEDPERDKISSEIYWTEDRLKWIDHVLSRERKWVD